MTNENRQNDSQFRRFLLGEMPEEERSKFEDEFILDQEKFENLRVAEDELIEDYVRGTLEGSEKAKFEAGFLTTEKRRQRVEFTRQMLANLKPAQIAEVKKIASDSESTSFFAAVSAFFKQPGFAIGTAFAVLLLMFGGWFWWKNSNQPIEVVKVTPTPSPIISVTPTPQIAETPTPKPESNANQPNKSTNQPLNQNRELEREVEANLDRQNQNSDPQPPKPATTPQPKPVISTLALFTGGVRSDGKTNELKLPKNSGGANLQLNLESQDYKTYRAEIVDQNGKIIYRSGKLVANKSKINAFVPTQNLKRGDYIVKLYGKNSKNEDESAADFQFRVNRE